MGLGPAQPAAGRLMWRAPVGERVRLFQLDRARRQLWPGLLPPPAVPNLLVPLAPICEVCGHPTGRTRHARRCDACASPKLQAQRRYDARCGAPPPVCEDCGRPTGRNRRARRCDDCTSPKNRADRYWRDRHGRAAA